MSNQIKPPRVFRWEEFLDDVMADAIHFSIGEEQFTIPPKALWPDKLPNVLREGYDALGQAILGEAPWSRFVAAGGTGRALNDFYARATEATQGVEPGESGASADS